ncbi:fast skeletal muscle,Myosin heavy chain [Trichinella spiralis]|uniref:Fast skeletal muscle,Myosin heavy chain n=1 Tax=Trichinella spiralis TaxID=6334 RepID=A0ABR3KM00_TRISP
MNELKNQASQQCKERAASILDKGDQSGGTVNGKKDDDSAPSCMLDVVEENLSEDSFEWNFISERYRIFKNNSRRWILPGSKRCRFEICASAATIENYARQIVKLVDSMCRELTTNESKRSTWARGMQERLVEAVEYSKLCEQSIEVNGEQIAGLQILRERLQQSEQQLKVDLENQERTVAQLNRQKSEFCSQIEALKLENEQLKHWRQKGEKFRLQLRDKKLEVESLNECLKKLKVQLIEAKKEEKNLAMQLSRAAQIQMNQKYDEFQRRKAEEIHNLQLKWKSEMEELEKTNRRLTEERDQAIERMVELDNLFKAKRSGISAELQKRLMEKFQQILNDVTSITDADNFHCPEKMSSRFQPLITSSPVKGTNSLTEEFFEKMIHLQLIKTPRYTAAAAGNDDTKSYGNDFVVALNSNDNSPSRAAEQIFK